MSVRKTMNLMLFKEINLCHFYQNKNLIFTFQLWFFCSTAPLTKKTTVTECLGVIRVSSNTMMDVQIIVSVIQLIKKKYWFLHFANCLVWKILIWAMANGEYRLFGGKDQLHSSILPTLHLLSSLTVSLCLLFVFFLTAATPTSIPTLPPLDVQTISVCSLFISQRYGTGWIPLRAHYLWWEQ